MKKISIIFFQVVVVLVGISALAFMFWEPQVEGRNVNATFFEIYFKDLFLAYAYTASIFFFTIFYKTFKVLGYVKENKTFSPETLKALRAIKRCAITILCFIVPAVAYLFIVRPSDDIAGGVFIGMLIILGSIAIVITAAKFERVLKNKFSKDSSC